MLPDAASRVRLIRLDSGPPGPDDDNFERGLGWLLDGFAQELGQGLSRPPTAAPARPQRR